MYYTYIYSDPSKNNEPIYVGKGRMGARNKDRALSHLLRRDNHPFSNRLKEMKKNNIKPIIEKIETGNNEKLALSVEMCLIKRIGRKNLGTGTLLNLTYGGENPPHFYGKEHHFYGKKRDLETRNKISISLKNKQQSSWNKGQTPSIQTKKKISETLKKKGIVPPSRKGCIPWNKGIKNA
jgi:hypothetical protein